VCPYDPPAVILSSLCHMVTEPVPSVPKYKPTNLNMYSWTHTNVFIICNVIMNVIRGYQDQQDAINNLHYIFSTKVMHKGIKLIQTLNTHLSSMDCMLVAGTVVKKQTAKNRSTLFLPQNVFYLFQKCPQWTCKYIPNRVNVSEWGIMLPGLSQISLTANMPRWLLTASTNSVQELS
jgi:hypothetical protein